MSNDLISRQALKQAMYSATFELDSNMQKWDAGCWIRYKLVEKIVDIMPSVQPEQKTGRWIPFDCDTWECSECKTLFTTLEGTPKDNLFNFCPNCGAKMESDNNDS